MKVLVVGSGGREHALAWKLAQSPRVTEVLLAPGNAGTAGEPKCRNIDVAADDVNALLALAQRNQVGLTVVGPEVPLAAGITDRFRQAGQRTFGPSRAAAEIETSKAFAKDFLARHGIPTARYRVFETATDALDYITAKGAPIVVKADGLAAGKGVTVAESLTDAQEAISRLFSQTPVAGKQRVVVEDFLTGEEASYIVVASGTDYVPLASAKDHKRAFDDDRGPNTGGMGAYSPAPVITPAVDARIRSEIIEPTLRALSEEGRPFCGFLYAGLIVTPSGMPTVIEFNARLGDPEAQPILMRLESDLLSLLEAATDGSLKSQTPRWNPQSALGVVLAAGGYPGETRRGDPISGLDSDLASGVKVFHAGTRLHQGTVITDGGRVLCVCALGNDFGSARLRAYGAADRIFWPMMQYRTDIGRDALPQT